MAEPGHQLFEGCAGSSGESAAGVPQVGPAQAVKVALGAQGVVKMSQPTGRSAAHHPGWPLQRQGHLEIVF